MELKCGRETDALKGEGVLARGLEQTLRARGLSIVSACAVHVLAVREFPG